jgi:hypothetical protein
MSEAQEPYKTDPGNPVKRPLTDAERVMAALEFMPNLEDRDKNMILLGYHLALDDGGDYLAPVWESLYRRRHQNRFKDPTCEDITVPSYFKS